MEPAVPIARQDRIVAITADAVFARACAGRLPEVPRAIRELNSPEALRRPATFAELADLRWFAVEDERGEWPAIIGIRERFDPYGSEDVLEIVHVAGAARPSRDLIASTLELGRLRGRAVIAEVAIANTRARRYFARRGARDVRTVMRVGP